MNNHKTITILLISEHDIDKETFATILESFDQPCLILNTNQANVVSAIEEEPPDLIVVEISESQNESIHIIQFIKTHSRIRIPIVALGKRDAEITKSVLENGADYYVSKPITRNELYTTIKSSLEQIKNKEMFNKQKDIITERYYNRAYELEQELIKRREVERELKQMVQYIEGSKRAALNLMDDLQEEIVEREQIQKELERSQLQLRELNRYAQEISEQEKTKISREIHDVVGQGLTALKFDLHWIKKNISNPSKELEAKFEQMTHLIDDTTTSVQRISTELRPGLLDDLGLYYALEWQAKQFEERTGIKTRLNCEPEDFTLDEKISVQFFRIVQESLTNIARHSKASEATISVKINNSKVELTISDNGMGISDENINDPKSLGLLGIHERVHSIGGILEISGQKNNGTIVKVQVKINEEVK